MVYIPEKPGPPGESSAARLKRELDELNSKLTDRRYILTNGQVRVVMLKPKNKK